MRSATTDVYLTEELQRDLRARLARLEGHVGSVGEMLERKVPCEDLIVQVSACRAALDRILALLLQGHLEQCVMAHARAGKGEEALRSFREAFARVLRRL